MRSSVGSVLLAAACSSVAACGAQDDARDRLVVSVLTRSDEALLRTRPRLVATKYRLMAADPYAFFRGSLPLYRFDFEHGSSANSLFALDSPLVRGLGDAHLENFGTLRASDGSLALEANDFDAADRVPYLWDVRRLTTSLVIASVIAGHAREESARFAREAAVSYAEAMARLAEGQPRGACFSTTCRTARSWPTCFAAPTRTLPPAKSSTS